MQPIQKPAGVKGLQPNEAARLCALALPVALYLCFDEDVREIRSLARGLGLPPWDRMITRSLEFSELVRTLDEATVATGKYEGPGRYPTRVARLKNVILAAVELVKERLKR